MLAPFSVWICSCALAFVSSADSLGHFRLATFSCNVTPPVDGHPLIWLAPVKVVETPLLAKGVILEEGSDRYVVCSLDWCGLSNSSHELFVKKIAEAAGTSPERVAVHTIHQHTAPYTDGDAQRLLSEIGFPQLYVDFAFLERVTDQLAESVREACGRFQPFNQVGLTAVKVHQVAATRRAKTPDGKLVVRYSSCKDPAIRELPEGRIDPLLRSVTLAHDGRVLVRIHYYATHPQSFYGDPRASSDVPGFARERLQQEEGVFQIYFTGCAGDVTMGKYNDGSREARDVLTERLYQAMRQAAESTRLEPVRRLAWRTVQVCFPARSDPGHTEADKATLMRNQQADPVQRVRAACAVAFHRRHEKPFTLSCLQVNEGSIVHLPGECMVEFQLFAQSVLPDKFVATAAYGDLGTGYICTELSYAEGGYEPTASHLSPEAEGVLKEAIRRLLLP